MNILLGSNVSDEVIDEWIERIDREFGLEALDDKCKLYIKSIKNECIMIVEKDFEAVLAMSVDMWMNKEMHVVSYYILPEKRNVRLFLKIQKKFEELAKAFDCKFLVQGSHFSDKLYSYLERAGYQVCAMKKEII